MRVRLRHDKLAQHLARSRRSQNAWALRLRLSRGHLSDLVQGKHPYPSAGTRKKLLDGLEIGFEDLFEIEESATASQGNRLRPSAAPPASVPASSFALLQRPGFLISRIALAALLAAICSGAWRVVDQLFLTPLPYSDPQRLIVIREQDGGRTGPSPSWPNFNDIRSRSRLLESVAAYVSSGRVPVRDAQEPIALTGTIVTAEFFDTLQVSPHLGTLPAESPALSAAMPVAIGFDLWRDRYQSDPATVGSSIQVSGASATISAVLPAGFSYPGRTQIWIPHSFFSSGVGGRQSHNFGEVVARLKPDVEWDALVLELDAIAQRLTAHYPALGQGFGLAPLPLQQFLNRRVAGRALLIASLAAILWPLALLAAACSSERRTLEGSKSRRVKESKSRKDFDRDPRRFLSASSDSSSLRLFDSLTPLLLVEGLLVAAAAGLIGWLAGLFLAEAVASALEISEAGSAALDGSWAPTARLAAVILALALSLGLIPAYWTAYRLRSGLQGVSRSTGRPIGRLVLVLGASAALVLLWSALNLGAAWFRLMSIDPGFDPWGLIEVRLNLPHDLARTSPGGEDVYAFHERLLGQVAALDGVQGAALAFSPPLSDALKIDSEMVRVGPATQAPIRGADFRVVSPGYFRTIGLTRISGRVFQRADHPGAEPAAVVNQSFAAMVWGTADPIGKQLRVPGQAFEPMPRGKPLRIIGVVSDLRQRALQIAPRPALYVPYVQHPVRAPYMRLLVRASESPEEVAALVWQIIHEVNPEIPASQPRILEDLIERRTAPARFRALAAALGAGLAMLLAFSVLSDSTRLTVLRRRDELALQRTSGANRSRLVWNLLRPALLLLPLILILSWMGAAALNRLLEIEVLLSQQLILLTGGCLLLAVLLSARLVRQLKRDLD